MFVVASNAFSVVVHCGREVHRYIDRWVSVKRFHSVTVKPIGCLAIKLVEFVTVKLIHRLPVELVHFVTVKLIGWLAIKLVQFVTVRLIHCLSVTLARSDRDCQADSLFVCQGSSVRD